MAKKTGDQKGAEFKQLLALWTKGEITIERATDGTARVAGAVVSHNAEREQPVDEEVNVIAEAVDPRLTKQPKVQPGTCNRQERRSSGHLMLRKSRSQSVEITTEAISDVGAGAFSKEISQSLPAELTNSSKGHRVVAVTGTLRTARVAATKAQAGFSYAEYFVPESWEYQLRHANCRLPGDGTSGPLEFWVPCDDAGFDVFQHPLHMFGSSLKGKYFAVLVSNIPH